MRTLAAVPRHVPLLAARARDANSKDLAMPLGHRSVHVTEPTNGPQMRGREEASDQHVARALAADPIVGSAALRQGAGTRGEAPAQSADSLGLKQESRGGLGGGI